MEEKCRGCPCEHGGRCVLHACMKDNKTVVDPDKQLIRDLLVENGVHPLSIYVQRVPQEYGVLLTATIHVPRHERLPGNCVEVEKIIADRAGVDRAFIILE